MVYRIVVPIIINKLETSTLFATISVKASPQFARGIKLKIELSTSMIVAKYGIITKKETNCKEDCASLYVFALPDNAIQTPDANKDANKITKMIKKIEPTLDENVTSS